MCSFLFPERRRQRVKLRDSLLRLMALGKFSRQAPLFFENFLPYIHLNGKDNNRSNKTCSPNPITRENSSFSFFFCCFYMPPDIFTQCGI